MHISAAELCTFYLPNRGLKYPSMIHCQFSGSIIFMSFTSELINDLVADMYEQETRSR